MNWDQFVAKKDAAVAALPECGCCKETLFPQDERHSFIESDTHLCSGCDKEHEIEINEDLCVPCDAACRDDLMAYGFMDSRCQKDQHASRVAPEQITANQQRLPI